MSERDKVQGARNAGTEIVHRVQRGSEYRATPQFARVATYSDYPKLIVCADDYAQSQAIDDAIIALIQRGVLSATSCMTLSPRWPEAAKRLTAEIRKQADIGLHLDFTQYAQSAFYTHRSLAVRSCLRLLPLTAVKNNIEQQLNAFEQGMGTPPDYIDGHLHVHQLPQIRDCLIEILQQRYGHLSREHRPWLRVARPPLATGMKAMIIRCLGARALKGLAAKQGLNSSPLLLGVYDFSAGSAAYFTHWQKWIAQLHAYQTADSNALPPVLMCHPATHSMQENDYFDAIAEARESEWQLLSSPAFAKWRSDTQAFTLVKGTQTQ